MWIKPQHTHDNARNEEEGTAQLADGCSQSRLKPVHLLGGACSYIFHNTDCPGK